MMAPDMAPSQFHSTANAVELNDYTDGRGSHAVYTYRVIQGTARRELGKSDLSVMEPHVPIVSVMSHTDEAMEWLQPEYRVAPVCAVQREAGHERLQPSSAYSLDTASQLHENEVLQNLHVQSLPLNSPTFPWSDFSPRSISDPGAANPLTSSNANLSPESILSKDFKQEQRPVAMPSFGGVVCPAPLGEFEGLGFPSSAFLMPPGTTSQQYDASHVTALQQPVPPSLPPLPAITKRGRGAPRKATKAKAGASAAKAEPQTPDSPGAKSVSNRPQPAISTEQKRRVRAERNRESAEKSRLRRKKYTEDLENEVGNLRETNKTLKSRAENLIAMLQRVDAGVEESVARGAGFVGDAPNGGAALKAALLALENVKRQCPTTFAKSSPRVEIGSSATKRK